MLHAVFLGSVGRVSVPFVCTRSLIIGNWASVSREWVPGPGCWGSLGGRWWESSRRKHWAVAFWSAEVELVLMSTGWHWIGTGGNGSCVCTALTGGGVSRRLLCRCLECPGGWTTCTKNHFEYLVFIKIKMEENEGSHGLTQG